MLLSSCSKRRETKGASRVIIRFFGHQSVDNMCMEQGCCYRKAVRLGYINMNNMIDSPLLNIFPAKAATQGSTWLPLWMHSLDTAETMMRLLNDWLPGHIEDISGLTYSEFRKCCYFVSLVHDIGKLTPVFAARILEQLPEARQKLEALGLRIYAAEAYRAAKNSPHAKAGEAILLNYHCPSGMAAVVGAHHGKPQDSRKACAEDPEIYGENYYGDSTSRETWDALRKEFLIWALAEAGFGSVSKLPDISQPVQVIVTGLIIMADWIASNTLYFPLLASDNRGNAALYPARAEQAWDRLGLPRAWEPMSFAMDAIRFEEVFGFEPNPVQRMMLQAAEGSGGIYILEAQMGVGKTEAALAAAEVLASKNGSGGVFFGLPTQATANGIFGRLTKWANTQAEETRQAIRLAHGMAELNDEYRAIFHGSAAGNDDAEVKDRLIVHPWFKGHKQALLASFVIGTVDQLLMSALKQKHVMLRHLGLAGKVVILDECHAYDAYMNQYLDRALNWLGTYGVPVIVLSATLPEQRRAEMIEAYLNKRLDEGPQEWRSQRAYPLLTWTDGEKICQTAAEMNNDGRSVGIGNLDSTEWISCLRSAVRAGGCCGVIVNTVQLAQRLAKEAAEAIPEAEVMLLHSRFVATDRAEMEAELLRRAGKQSGQTDRSGLIVIGTQVLEQSLDIDFDLLITQLCPMDLLLQRIGRLHRHHRIRPEQLAQPYCYVLDLNKPCDDGSRTIYGDWLLMRTRELLPEMIVLPQSIPQLVQETYRKPDEVLLRDPEHFSAWERHDALLKDKRRKADNYRVAAPRKAYSRNSTIDGWLKVSFPADGVRGEAAVRDGEPSITVLAMQEHADGRISFLPWREGGMTVSATHAPDEETARKIAGQRLNLPVSFSAYGREEETIEALEAVNRRKLPEWQNSGWLNGELVLLFDDELRTSLREHSMRYSEKYGLMWEREDKENGSAL